MSKSSVNFKLEDLWGGSSESEDELAFIQPRKPCKKPKLTGNEEEAEQQQAKQQTVTLTDQDVFECPICFQSLRNHVYQCEDGHVVCDTCVLKMKNKCQLCSKPNDKRCLAIENVLEAIEVSCKNRPYGCCQVLRCCDKRDHEYTCMYSPCSCPIQNCKFVGTERNLCRHFLEKHDGVSIRTNIFFTATLEEGMKFLVLPEKSSGILFVLNLGGVGQGMSVVRIGPKSSKVKYCYKLVVERNAKTLITVNSPVERVINLGEYSPTGYFPVVENSLIPSL